MNWKRRLLQNFKLYAITDLRTYDLRLSRVIEQVVQGGVDVVQLRSKTLSDREFLKIGYEIRKVTQKYQRLFFVNDRLDLALALEADGVHLGQDDLPLAVARKLAKQRKLLIGKSTHSLAQAKQAEREGADYIGFGPIFKTPTKPNYFAIGFKEISKLKQAIKIPFACIGGINATNIDQLVQAGVERVAVVRAIFNESNPFEAAKELKGRLKE
ncbi:MAG: thiamine phosphate synthase [Candidatus Omnitrophica bacterium]|nr:thiamine phosphate synthase [Candidatus Omnitrophota bacterium]